MTDPGMARAAGPTAVRTPVRTSSSVSRSSSDSSTFCPSPLTATAETPAGASRTVVPVRRSRR
ncbi:hypothetical protein ADK42_29930 [Streptomyces rimosus subsp. rimosus]|nr:hypothetical protein ADK42_29930 [Streptomyces rimosus subsp. rimosus]